MPSIKIISLRYKTSILWNLHLSISICINLMIQLSYIQGHEIRIVSYALLDGGDCQFY